MNRRKARELAYKKDQNKKINDAINKFRNSKGHDAIVREIEKNTMKYNRDFIGESDDPNELMNFDVPLHIKSAVDDAVFDYLDSRNIQYCKAESSIVLINHISVPCLISFSNYPQSVRLKIPTYSRITGRYNRKETWEQITTFLPKAIVQKVAESIENQVTNTSEISVLFKDFAQTIMKSPPSASNPMGFSGFGEPEYIEYTVSTYFQIVHKNSHGITPDLNQIKQL